LVADGSSAALICDTGALLEYLVKAARDHQRFRQVIDAARTRYVPGLVLAEVDYFLRDERSAMNVFMQDLSRGAFTYAPPGLDQLARAMEIDRRCAGARLSELASAAFVEGLKPICTVQAVETPTVRSTR
jgi:predicted nucleic acid-binding protein